MVNLKRYADGGIAECGLGPTPPGAVRGLFGEKRTRRAVAPINCKTFWTEIQAVTKDLVSTQPIGMMWMTCW